MKWLVLTQRVGRSRDLEDIDITVKWRLSRWWGLFIIPLLSGHIFYPERPPHPRFSTIKSALNKKDGQILKKIDELKKLLSDREHLLDWITQEIEDEGRDLDIHGVGQPRWMTFKELKDWLQASMTYHSRPDTSEFVKFFSPGIIREYKLHPRLEGRGSQGPQGQRRAGPGGGGPIVPGRGESSAYTLEEFANKSLHIAEETGARQVLGYRENKDGNKGDNKARMDKLRQDYPRREGESNNDWNNRLQKIMKDQQ